MTSFTINHRYLWDTRFVLSELKDNHLSEAAIFRYFLVLMGFDWLQFTMIATADTSNIASWSVANAWITFGLTIIGLVFLYTRNGGREGQYFLQRYFSLSIVVGWKFLMATLCSDFAMAYVLAEASANIKGWGTTIVYAIWNAAMFLRLGKHIVHLSQHGAGTRRAQQVVASS